MFAIVQQRNVKMTAQSRSQVECQDEFIERLSKNTVDNMSHDLSALCDQSKGLDHPIVGW